MAHVDNQAHAVHFLDDLFAHAGHATVVGLVASTGQQRLVVVGELHKPRTKGVDYFNQADVVLNRRRVLKAEKYRRFTQLFSQTHIVACAALHDELWVSLKPQVPLLYVEDGFTQVFVVRNSDVYSMYAALLQLFKNLWRPVVVLKRVYSVSRLVHGCTSFKRVGQL